MVERAMRWPWISRAAFDVVCADKDRLLTLVESLAARFYRLERVEAGLPEKEPQERTQAIPWDGELEHAVMAWGSHAAQQRQMAQRRLREGWSRDSVLAQLRPESEEEA